MRRMLLKIVWIFVLLFSLSAGAFGEDEVMGRKDTTQGRQVFQLENGLVRCAVVFENNILSLERLGALSGLNPQPGKSGIDMEWDGDFAIDVQWTDWAAPGKVENAANPVILTRKSFRLHDSRFEKSSGGALEMVLFFRGADEYNSLELLLSYRLSPEAFYVKRRLGVRDKKGSHHFLRWFWPRYGIIPGDIAILKSGGFGMPLALLTGDGGAFFGMEYPAAENLLKPAAPGKTEIQTGQEMGVRISGEWLLSDWSVAGLTPDPHVKLWFDKYLDRDIRIAPLKPYLLYNTWYDVRAPEYVDRPEDVMNEANLLRIINDFKREMTEKRGLKLDVFVLDDGWDVYKSDWELRKKEFPNGLKPVADALKGMGTDLGIWFGPIGGYSHRNWRVDWMTEHGYETEGDQLCIAGKNYKNLFRKRNVDFVTLDHVAYFKWDGIQFSCSEPDHGHPVDIYSRRAVMEAVSEMCQAVRTANPRVYLNITSGTWLSPWWLKFADTIWMQGEDYGYANVPSVSLRDSAITYRDLVLYEDFGIHKYWFPLANLMTHGIIKGHLQKLGGENEPLDKFTNSVMFYFARGVTMYELYISPNLLSDGEWEALGRSIRWAKDRFEILKQTEMIGGDPGKRDAYGYVHFKGKRGIVAARNPFIEPKTLHLELDPGKGLDPRASSLVLERIYPTRWISPRLYASGAALDLPLDGYEAAVYEIYPLEEAKEPLLAGTVFDVNREEGADYRLRVRRIQPDARLLNPETVAGIIVAGDSVPLHRFVLPVSSNTQQPVSFSALKPAKNGAAISFQLELPAESGEICLLLEPSRDVAEYIRLEQEKEKKEKKALKKSDLTKLFNINMQLDGKMVLPITEGGEGSWMWLKTALTVGKSHVCSIAVEPVKKRVKWSGSISAYIVYNVRDKDSEVTFTTANPLGERRPFPPTQLPAGMDRGVAGLGKIEIK